MTDAQPTSYDGFLSYSHAADDLLAPRLQAGLQRFAKPWWKRRATRIFRDEASLSANPHLWSSITDALDDSDWFVLLLSPEAAGSEWVNREIDYWKAHRDPHKILPVVTDGEFWWDGDVGGDATPASLQGVFADEPHWVDLRFARIETQLDLRHARFRDAVASIAAAIRGVPKDELESEEIRQHRRTVRTAWVSGVAILALGVAATVGAVAAYNAQQDAENNATVAQEERDRAVAAEQAATEERDRANLLAAQEAAARADAEKQTVIAQANANLARSRELAASAINVLDKDPELSLLLALEAAEVDDPPFESVAALHDAVLSHQSLLSYPVDGWTATAFAVDGSWFVVADGDRVIAVDAQDGEELWHSRLPAGISAGVIAFAATDGSQILIPTYWEKEAFETRRLDQTPGPLPGLYAFDIETGDFTRRKVDWPCGIAQVAMNSYGWVALDLPLYVLALAPNANGDCDAQDVAILEIQADGSIEELARYRAVDWGNWEMSVSGDGRYLAFEFEGQNLLMDIESRSVVPVGPTNCCGTSNVLNGDGSRWVSMGAVGQVSTDDWGIFDTTTGEMVRSLDGLRSTGFVLFSSDESMLVTSGHEGNAHVWNVETGFEVATLTGLGGVAGQLHLNADGTRLLSKTATVIKVWSVEPLGEVAALDMFAAPETSDYLRDEFPSRNLDIVGETAANIYSGDPFCDAVIFDIGTGEVRTVIESVTVQDIELSPDGRRIAVQQRADTGMVGLVRIHEATTGEPLVAMDGWCEWDGWAVPGPDCQVYPERPFPDYVHSLEFSPDGSLLAAATKAWGSESVTVWDARTGEMLLNVGPGTGPFAFSPDGDRFVVFHHQVGNLIAYRTQDWSEVDRWEGASSTLPSQTSMLGYTPDGTHLIAIGNWNAELAVIDLNNRRVVDREIVAVEGYVRDFDVSPDGSAVAVISTDGFVRVYRLPSADAPHLILELAIPVFDSATRLNVEFLDNTHIFALPGTGPGVTLTTDIGELLQIARNRLTRGFTQTECDTYRIDPCPDLEDMKRR